METDSSLQSTKARKDKDIECSKPHLLSGFGQWLLANKLCNRWHTITITAGANVSSSSSGDHTRTGFLGTVVRQQQVPVGGLSTITSLSAGVENKCVAELIALRTRGGGADDMETAARARRPASGRSTQSWLSSSIPRSGPTTGIDSNRNQINLRFTPPTLRSLRRFCSVSPSLPSAF